MYGAFLRFHSIFLVKSSDDFEADKYMNRTQLFVLERNTCILYTTCPIMTVSIAMYSLHPSIPASHTLYKLKATY